LDLDEEMFSQEKCGLEISGLVSPFRVALRGLTCAFGFGSALWHCVCSSSQNLYEIKIHCNSRPRFRLD
jgi:hypothetical protein